MSSQSYKDRQMLRVMNGQERDTLASGRSPAEQLRRLDEGGFVARKERAKLQAKIDLSAPKRPLGMILPFAPYLHWNGEKWEPTYEPPESWNNDSAILICAQ